MNLHFCKIFSNKVLITYTVKLYIIKSDDLEEIVKLQDAACCKKDEKSCKIITACEILIGMNRKHEKKNY